MFPRTAHSALSTLTQHSTRQLVNGTAQQASPLASRTLSASSLHYSTSPSSILQNLHRSATTAIDTAVSSSTSPLRSLLHARSLTTRSAAYSSSSPFVSSSHHQHQAISSSLHTWQAQSRAALSSRKYTSSSPVPSSSASAPSSSSSNAAGSAARVIAAESSSSHVKSTATSVSRATTNTTIAGTATTGTASKSPLSFHEEMTKERFSFNWWKEWTIIMGVFAVTGSSTVMIVRPLLKEGFNLDGTWREGPWSFRIAYLCTTLPLYSCVLLTVASLAGRRPYFKKVVLRMWGRFLPKKALQRFQ